MQSSTLRKLFQSVKRFAFQNEQEGEIKEGKSCCNRFCSCFFSLPLFSFPSLSFLLSLSLSSTCFCLLLKQTAPVPADEFDAMNEDGLKTAIQQAEAQLSGLRERRVNVQIERVCSLCDFQIFCLSNVFFSWFSFAILSRIKFNNAMMWITVSA